MKTFSRVVLAAAVTVGLMGAASTLALADHDNWNDHEEHARDWHEHHRHHHDHDRPVVVQEPNVVYAPPVVVESPAPEEEPSGINLVFPINIH
jgi:hypothetical protein